MIGIKDLPKLVELVPPATLERLRGLFKAVTGVPLVFTDADGRPLTTIDNPLHYCASLVCQEGNGTVCLRRSKWDVPEPELERSLKPEENGSRPIRHRCRGGFKDTAVPIVVEGRPVGYAIFARTLTQPPDVERFRRLAVGGEVPPEVGEQVARHALVMPEQKVNDVAEFLWVIAGLVASAAYDALRSRQVLQLERLTQDLIRMIVHDLRTPLTGVLSGLRTVRDTDYEPGVVREIVPIALGSADALLEIVNSLLHIHQLESGEMKLELAPTSFTEVAAQALNQVRSLAQECQQELTADIDDPCPPIEADADMLRRVLVNLLGNAIKFTQLGSRITLSAHCSADALAFSVSDNGPGIPPEYRDRIFEKFVQFAVPEAGHARSTGLGLTFCKMVAEAHGGRIWVDSEAGHGSTFTVVIPTRRPPAEPS